MTVRSAEGPIGNRSALAVSRSRGGWRVVVWIVLVLVLAAALVIGASHRSAPQSPAARAASLDADLRCPSCDDVSVANSSAASAVAIRQLVLADTKAGVSDQAIVEYLQSRYPGIVLRPSASGVEGIVWFAPLVGFAVAVFVIGRVFWRKRSRPLAVRVDDADRLLVADALKAASHGGDGAGDKVAAFTDDANGADGADGANGDNAVPDAKTRVQL